MLLRPWFLWLWPSAHLHRWVCWLSSAFWQYTYRFAMGFRLREFSGQSSTLIMWSLNQVSVLLAVWKEWKGANLFFSLVCVFVDCFDLVFFAIFERFFQNGEVSITSFQYFYSANWMNEGRMNEGTKQWQVIDHMTRPSNVWNRQTCEVLGCFVDWSSLKASVIRLYRGCTSVCSFHWFYVLFCFWNSIK